MGEPIIDECIAWTAEGAWTAPENIRLQAATVAHLRRLKAIEEALTPSGDTKAAYSGEFRMLSASDRPGAMIPWDTIKQIMAAIRARATLTETPT